MLLNKLISKNVSTSYCLKKPGAKALFVVLRQSFIIFAHTKLTTQ